MGAMLRGAAGNPITEVVDVHRLVNLFRQPAARRLMTALLGCPVRQAARLAFALGGCGHLSFQSPANGFLAVPGATMCGASFCTS